jgi:GNAT superfamily N-acetyltransferase
LNVSVRPAEPNDADAVTALLLELGYQVTATHVRQTLGSPSESDTVYVATHDGAVVGMIALHVAQWIQLERPIARIPAMIVQGQFQRRGIGRRLIERALDHARTSGCGTVELTSANERDDAHAFYRDLGFEQTSIRFKRTLP